MSNTVSTRKPRRRADYVDVFVDNVPATLRRALEQAANDDETSINGVVVKALADEYGIAYDPAVRPARRSTGKRSATKFLYLTMPRSLRKKLNAERARTDVAVSALVISILSRRFL